MGTNRLEAFSDGVFAIIITIMVLELKVPHGADLAALVALWPVFLSYVLSFVFIGIYWNNHHHMLQVVRRICGANLWGNLHLLFWLSLVPFVTGWMGENHFAPTPVALYGIILLGAACAYWLLQRSLIKTEGPGCPLARAVGRDWKGKLLPRSTRPRLPWRSFTPGSPARFTSLSRSSGSYRIRGSSASSPRKIEEWASADNSVPLGTKPSALTRVRVLIADDERAFALLLAEMVRSGGHEVVDVVYSGLDAIRSYRRHKPQVVLMDFAMARLNGLTACRNILSDDPSGRILFVSGLSDHRSLAPQSSGALAVLQKPINYALLEQVLSEAAATAPRPRTAAAWSG